MCCGRRVHNQNRCCHRCDHRVHGSLNHSLRDDEDCAQLENHSLNHSLMKVENVKVELNRESHVHQKESRGWLKLGNVGSRVMCCLERYDFREEGP